MVDERHEERSPEDNLEPSSFPSPSIKEVHNDVIVGYRSIYNYLFQTTLNRGFFPDQSAKLARWRETFGLVDKPRISFIQKRLIKDCSFLSDLSIDLGISVQGLVFDVEGHERKRSDKFKEIHQLNGYYPSSGLTLSKFDKERKEAYGLFHQFKSETEERIGERLEDLVHFNRGVKISYADEVKARIKEFKEANRILTMAFEHLRVAMFKNFRYRF